MRVIQNLNSQTVSSAGCQGAKAAH